MNLSEEDSPFGLQASRDGWRKKRSQRMLRKAEGEAGRIVHIMEIQPQRGEESVEIKGRVSFRRRRVKLYPERSNEIRSRKEIS